MPGKHDEMVRELNIRLARVQEQLDKITAQIETDTSTQTILTAERDRIQLAIDDLERAVV